MDNRPDVPESSSVSSQLPTPIPLPQAFGLSEQGRPTVPRLIAYVFCSAKGERKESN